MLLTHTRCLQLLLVCTIPNDMRGCQLLLEYTSPNQKQEVHEDLTNLLFGEPAGDFNESDSETEKLINADDVGQGNLELEPLACILEVDFDGMRELDFLEYPHITLGHTTLTSTYSKQLAVGIQFPMKEVIVLAIQEYDFKAFTYYRATVVARSLLLYAPKNLHTPTISTQFHSLVPESHNKLVTIDVSLLHHSSLNFYALQRLHISSFASPKPSEKDHEGDVENNGQEPIKPGGDTNPGEAEVTDQAKESGSESDGELSMADMVKLVQEKEGLLEVKQMEIEQMKDKVVRTLAEMENVMARTRREAENSKKFAIQNFAKGLLDVADNLGRASTHVKGSFAKVDESKDTAGAVPLLKTLLEGVEMTEKQLGEVFRKFGVEKFDPTNEPFDPHRHNAVFQVPDNAKPPGMVAHVLKAGYMLHDRVIRPAEVGVTQALNNDAN
ncbi:hypothetical protein PVK06_041250 [Gossypium arboreum]|uniref:GrpE protein homolog n=1 Tax=Gossypium arboreum TaxID=29729 RepID=A0ABR0N9Y0_GOSAR|nr:hypothetical protein PVK06_041250 [Gossypium arboreum]